MSILVEKDNTVLIQGITGREGSRRAKFMKEYGTKVIAGVTPGRGGQEVHDVPVYDTVEQAVKNHGQIDASVIFVPGAFVKDAALEAIDGGIKFLVMPVERIPLHDILVMLSYAKKHGAKILGPGSIGIIDPRERVALGWLGGSIEMAEEVFQPGPVGIISRSGGQSATVPWTILQEGLGSTTTVHVGTEPMIGITMAEILPLFEKDEETQAVAVFGEIGGTQEDEAAELIKEGGFTKPLVIYVAGAWAPEGMRFSHASSIIEHGKGSATEKMEALRDAGAHVVDRPEKLGSTVKKVIESN